MQASPHVAGIVAYWISLYNNNLPPRIMKKLLRDVAVKGQLSDLRELLAWHSTNFHWLCCDVAPGTDNLVANNNSDDQVNIEGYKGWIDNQYEM